MLIRRGKPKKISPKPCSSDISSTANLIRNYLGFSPPPLQLQLYTLRIVPSESLRSIRQDSVPRLGFEEDTCKNTSHRPYWLSRFIQPAMLFD
jgi:hypothetical protein